MELCSSFRSLPPARIYLLQSEPFISGESFLERAAFTARRRARLLSGRFWCELSTCHQDSRYEIAVFLTNYSPAFQGAIEIFGDACSHCRFRCCMGRWQPLFSGGVWRHEAEPCAFGACNMASLSPVLCSPEPGFPQASFHGLTEKAEGVDDRMLLSAFC